MDSAALQKYLLELFDQHEVELEVDEDGWLVTDGDFPAIRASWHADSNAKAGRLDVDVVLSEDRRIEESFAGVGSAEDACRDALRGFEENAFHLLLAACWYVTDDRKMQITAWDIGVRTWDVFIGPVSVRGTGAEGVKAPVDALTAVEEALKREALTPELHWVRLVHRHSAEGARGEASLDNEPWAAGTQALATAAWPNSASEYSARSLILLDVRDY